TVREALRQLEQTRFVTRRVGSGTYVRYREQINKDDIAEATSPLELIEVRLAVESRLARLAVLNASARNIQHLQDALQRLDAAGEDPNAFSQADEDFHLALAECAQNPLMLWLYHRINDIRGHNQWNARKDKILSPQRIGEYNQQHHELFQAIQSRDIQRAEQAITEHLNKAKHDLLGVNSS
ncbi:MAG: FCD domain-containing protein, partial [Gammaproteobacteria bacterium]|nr:FCD domain-containing protein [Gammaproteobacteria bacterium]